jgi:hypothetical protein
MVQHSLRLSNIEQCFKYIVNSPPPPLTEEDIWFQIGHVHEQQKDVGISRVNRRWARANFFLV